MVSLDGKSTAISGCDDHYAQRQTPSQASSLVGTVRTVTATLTSCNARPIIDVIPIPAHTNEMGQYPHALHAVLSHYSRSDLFRLVTYDAGACFAHNSQVTRELGLHYLFGLKLPHTSLLEEAYRVLGSLTDRYFVSSLPSSRLNAEQWLLLVRSHWRVELAHQTLDQAFAEDDKPWIRSNPQGMLVVAVLRRIAYTLLTVYRSVSLCSDAHRSLPWKDLLRWVELSLLTATDSLLTGLRRHRVVILE